MIYTVTFNPAVDYVMYTGDVRTGTVNRSRGEEIYVGGKGINVSIVLGELGIPSRALGFVAGFTGEEIERGVQEMGIETDFVHLAVGFSRINVKIKSGDETDLNGCGPDISEEALAELFKKLEELGEGDIVVLAGSIPGTLPPDIYERILGVLAPKKTGAAVDATGELLLNVLKYEPFLVKPNIDELGEMFGVRLMSGKEAVPYAAKLQEMGAKNVLVSMAGDGAFLLDEHGKLHTCGVCRGEVVNSVGAGDSMVAGFLAGSREGDYEYALRLGTAAGGATAFSGGLGKREDICRLLEQLSPGTNRYVIAHEK